MAVRFILGRSGSGKTSYCIKALVDTLLEPDSISPLILLVPEQASLQTERALLDQKHLVRGLPDSLGDTPAVLGPHAQDSKNQQIQRALKQIGFLAHRGVP